jgi:DNA polymerase II small subunit/DNA polymerase delta subunit B
MGRPATKPTELRDGFYIEIRNRGSKAGVKIRRDTKEQMLMAIKEYEKSKDVVVIGEVSKGKILDKVK